jgi:hypothetical protein
MFCIVISTQTKIKRQAIILDTNGISQASYSQLASLLESVGFSTTYTNMYTPIKDIARYDLVLFFVSGSFLDNSLKEEKSQITQNTLALVKKYQSNKNGMLAILFPGRMPQTKNNVKVLCELFKELGIKKELCSITKTLAPCIFSIDEQRSAAYRTSLLPAGTPKIKKKAINCKIDITTPLQQKPLTLPIGNPTDYLASIFPLGLYLKQKKEPGIFLSTDSSLNGAELQENMFFTPYIWKDREKYLKTVQQALWQMHYILTYQKMPTSPNKNLTLPSKITPIAHLLNKQGANRLFSHPLLEKLNKQKIRCAWMEIEPLNNHWKEATTFIKNADLNLLWFSFNPAWYLSSKATKTKKEFATIEKGIQRFTQELAGKFNEHSLPAIFAGFDLTNNFRKVPVKKAVKDIYGKKYTKIPSPLDEETIWQKEFLEPLKIFIQKWKQNAHKNIRLKGIFLDLEMYHAPEQAVVYSNTMDFSSFAWELYVQATQNKKAASQKNFKSRITFLIKNNEFKNYFSILEERSYLLGKKLKIEIQTLLPNSLIGVYIPSLLDCWFYKGLLAGLSTKEEPVILATFNSNYYGHTKWIKEHNINALHLPVTMLSHIENTQVEKELTKLHDGAWFNRFSRLFERCAENDWYYLECSKQKPSLVIDHIKAYNQ